MSPAIWDWRSARHRQSRPAIRRRDPARGAAPCSRRGSPTEGTRMNVFLAGASGAIGRRLIPLLRDAGHAVTGTTRSAGKAADLTARGITAVVVDVFDAQALRDAVMRARPEVVIHQLTDL